MRLFAIFWPGTSFSTVVVANFINFLLKPKTFKALGEIGNMADLFADAKGGVPMCVAKGQRKIKGVGQA